MAEADFFDVLNRIQKKLVVLQPEIEVTVGECKWKFAYLVCFSESCEHEHMEKLITILKLVWLREKNRWGLRDKKHFLTVDPTMYVENIPE